MPHTGIVYGPPGAGKSTVIARLAIGAARRVPAVIVSAEEGTAAPFKQRLSRCGLDEMTGHRLTVSDARTLAELSEDVGAAEPHALVFVDSLTEMGCTPDALAECLHGRSWWATQHLTTGGTPRGGLTASHLVDVVVRVVNGQATPTKNRWGSSKCIDVFPEEQAA
jgi:hypothetical protein